MAVAARLLVDTDIASSPAFSERPIDLVHLARMTLGDRSLEREVLQLFARQAELLLARMDLADTGGVATLAHTLKGSAKGIGAWHVVRAAEEVELSGTERREQAMRELRLAVNEARTFIEGLLLPN